jgi:hypothetical protein
MRRTLALIAIAVFAAVGIVKVIFIPSTTVAGTHAQTALPVYELDVGHSGMKTLPVEPAPMP